MKITVERDPFAHAISAAMHAADRSALIPVLKNLLLQPNGETLGIAGTNMGMRLETGIPAEVDGDSAKGAISVLGEALVGVVSRFPSGRQISMEWNEPSAGAVLTCGRSRYKLLALPADEYPVLSVPEDGVTRFAIPAKELAHALDVVRFAIGNDPSRPFLNGVYMHHGNDEHPAFGAVKEARFIFIATTAFEFARVSMPVPVDSKDAPPVILPGESIPEIVRLAKDFSGDIAITVSKNLVRFSDGKSALTTKLIDYTYPTYQKAIPSEGYEIEVRVDAEQLAQALARLRMMGESKITPRTIAELTSGELRLSFTNPDSGNAEEVLEVEYEGTPFSTGIRARGILSVLESMGADVCLIRISRKAHAPILFNAVRGPVVEWTRTFLSMPVMLGG